MNHINQMLIIPTRLRVQFTSASCSLIGAAFSSHVERSHWLLRMIPCAGLMGAAGALSFHFKIYSPRLHWLSITGALLSRLRAPAQS